MIKRLGFNPDEELSDELIKELEKQILDILDSSHILPTNGITIKTGCVLHNIILENYEEIKEQLIQQIIHGRPLAEKFHLRLRFQSLCLHLNEYNECNIIKEPCPFIKQPSLCEIVQESVKDPELEKWK